MINVHLTVKLQTMWARANTITVLRSLRSWNKLNDYNLTVCNLVRRGISLTSPAEDKIYTSEQRDVIIEKLNSVQSNQDVRSLLGERIATRIENYLQRNGKFSTLEDLLKVQTVGPKTIRQLCDKILDIAPAKRSSNPTVVRKGKTPVVMIPELMSVNTKLIVTLTIDPSSSISWTLVDMKRKYLLDWRSVSIEGQLLSLRSVILKAAEVEKELPDADLFLIEDATAMTMNSKGSHKLRSDLICALGSYIHSKREDDGQLKLITVQNKLVEKHFNATVGSETVSLQPFIQEFIDQKIVGGRSNLFIPQECIQYMKSLHPIGREFLCRSALLAVCCIDLVIAPKSKKSEEKVE